MNLNRFRECAEAYGAARRRWPQSEHALYDRLAGAAEGAAVLAEAEQRDRFLDSLATAPPDPALARRIGARVRPAWRRFALPAALAASALLGFAAGFVQARGEADLGIAARLLLGPQGVQEIEL
jgi:hypothetical protein